MLYNIISSFLFLIIFVFSIFNKKLRTFSSKRLFNVKSVEKGSYILIHASSLGEINLLEPFIKKILEDKNSKLIISVVTDTGYNQAISKYLCPQVKIIYFPLDSYFLIKKIFKYTTLEKVIIVETELWPNLINYSYKKSKLYLINGRISDKSFEKYKLIKTYLETLLNKFSYLIMQTESDRKKIISLGAFTNKVYNFGNLKFDISFDDYSSEELINFKENLGIKEKVFVAGSTREGEEEIILEVFKQLKGYKLILVPRHLDRISKIEKLLYNFDYSTLSNLSKSSDIIIVDKMGVLRKFYAIADIAFVGGTLVDIGGHSLLEPLYYGKTPIFGSYLQNVKDIASEMLNLNLGYKVDNVAEFLEAINTLSNSPAHIGVIREFLDTNSKSSEKSYKLIFNQA